jgi:hypothetical protein
MAEIRKSMSKDSISAGAWSWLERELDRWAGEQRRARFWWRDDDASAPGVKLDRLSSLRDKHCLPLALAVIPARIEAGFADSLRAHPGMCALQHGYAHQNHAPPGEQKLELGGTRSRSEVLADLRRGFDLLQAGFGAGFVPVLVPPWNRLRADVVDGLSAIGFKGLSAMKARREACPAPGLLQVNTHLDPVNWRQGGGFLGVYPAIAILVQHLSAKRNGYRDTAEPTGILSHHLVQNDAVWRFLDELLQFLAAHPAIEFVGADEIWE